MAKNKATSHNLALFYGALTTLIFSVHYLVAKEVLQHVHPLSLTGFRGFLGGVILFVVFRAWEEIECFKTDFLSLIAVAFFGFFLNVVLFFYGLKESTPLNASLINNTIPLVSALFGFFAGQEQLNPRKIFGMFLGFSLIIFLSLYRQGFAFNLGKNGDFLIFCNVLSLCLSFIIAKKTLSGKTPPHIMTIGTLLFGGFFSLIFGFSHNAQFIDYSFSDPLATVLIIFEVIFSSAIVYSLNFKVLQVLSPSQTTIFTYFQPLLTAILGLLVFSQAIDWVFLPVYFGIILSGYLVLKKD